MKAEWWASRAIGNGRPPKVYPFSSQNQTLKVFDHCVLLIVSVSYQAFLGTESHGLLRRILSDFATYVFTFEEKDHVLI